MNSQKLYFCAIAVLASHLSAYSQSYSFKVLVNKGKNEVKSGASWLPIKVGVSLSEKDEIKLATNSYMGLVHWSGKPIELKEANTYKVSDLSKRISTGSSVLTKYTDFILSANTKQKNNLEATGAVHRGPNFLSVFLPVKAEQSVYYNSVQTISWDNRGLTGPVTVKFTSLFDDEFKKIETSDNKISVDLDGPEFQNEDNLIVKVYSGKDKKESEVYTLKKLSKQDKARIENLLKDISASTAEETALNKYVLAGFYEENKLLIDAATNYLEAIRLAPDPSIYQQSYEDFLLRTGIKQPPAKD